MPPSNDLSPADLTALTAFLATPNAGGPSRGAGPGPTPARGGPVVASGGAPGGRAVPPGRAGGMVGPPYPPGIPVPEVRMYTGYGMNGAIVKPPYSTITAYDLNAGTIKWQIPAGGDDPRSAAAGAKDTGYISHRTGIITTAAGLMFQPGGDGKLRIYDSETGKVLWTGDMPAGSRGIPAMYQVNGRQYFVVNATSTIGSPGDSTQDAAPINRAYVAYALRPEGTAQ